ncbi:periplasmic nitrate reductase, diheme cytochrome c subunit [Campylobacter sputorum subsp. bubulus]|uniref:Periplasmic nitrate reductase, electron transfer subunit n=1 Tax=Campylobacter sputorum subsp. sputorum TaxID=32024 RepID=A0A381DL82_9BACT|nr:nitrate reductase cytochrome c-type subunit [Campylobacter sputorum]ASM36423.1 periplasmic nitrate reductase NapAB, small subunit, periplasmic diheme cytochrome c550 protein [Campylobacter sputorum bv. faecalis CCUG 20703]ASM38120.1 periplasmic nitrate reductase NapAB, small subunit, periplasmic diheme cytochrome c550 protein [Campylobacter sputorum bv. paraureolyticus LMG 11764]KAB0581683.1 nitrate reductase [Campylobacter sputorum subsp. sputorum]MDY6121268.1 nitrate reductase cytochrome c
MKKFAIFLIIIALFIGCSKNGGVISSSDLGLRQNIATEDIKLAPIDWTKEPAGLSTKYKRSFENAPPLISHDLEGQIPITADLNMCLTCHMPEVATSVNATSVPKSHLVSLRTAKDLGGKLDDERYFCLTCHVPQANAKPLVENKFKADFRSKDSVNKSNLLDILNEGVK